jgi:hypothetical protein
MFGRVFAVLDPKQFEACFIRRVSGCAGHCAADVRVASARSVWFLCR